MLAPKIKEILKDKRIDELLVQPSEDNVSALKQAGIRKYI